MLAGANDQFASVRGELPEEIGFQCEREHYCDSDRDLLAHHLDMSEEVRQIREGSQKSIRGLQEEKGQNMNDRVC